MKLHELIAQLQLNACAKFHRRGQAEAIDVCVGDDPRGIEWAAQQARRTIRDAEADDWERVT